MKNNLPKLVLAALLLTFFNVAKALPTGWLFAQAIQVQDNNGTSITNYQLQVSINTQALISAGQLNTTGSDLRFGKDCDGTILFNYWIESGLNTTNTIVWVKMDSVNALATHTMYMFYGNPSATSASAVNGTFFGPNSSTDSVASGGAGGATNSQRGFRFAPTETILVTDFGKREPNGSTRFITLFNFTTQAIIAQTQVGGPAAQYSYGSLPNPIWLTQGTQYLLELFQGATDGYYFGSSSQIGQHLTYFDMKYCNSCTQNTFPTNTLSNYHYGYPDLWYYTKLTIPVLPTITFATISAPTVSVTTAPSNTICQGSSVTLTATSSSPITWSGGVVNGVSFVPLSTQTYTVTASNACGATATSFSTITVNPSPASPVITSIPPSICPGGSSDLNAVSTGNTIIWYDALTAGTLLTTLPSATNYNVTPASTTTYYAEAVAPAGGTQVFTYTGSLQTFTVPPGVTSLTIDVKGAQGGNPMDRLPGNATGGLGGSSTGTLAVTPGQILNIYVGGQGSATGVGGFNGGGTGGSSSAGTSCFGGGAGGGGGASDIRIGGVTLADRVIVGAGGGGAGRDYCNGTCQPCGCGGGGGGAGALIGLNGSAGYDCGYSYPGSGINFGSGATQIGGGLLGPGDGAGPSGTAGIFGIGGDGASGSYDVAGGGAGGGYYGGGGGGSANSGSGVAGGGGGGGSSYIGGVTSATTASGIQAGDGVVTITWTGAGCVSNPRIPVTVTVNTLPIVSASATPNDTVCTGNPVTLQGSGASTYTWNATATLTSDTTLTPAVAGTYTIVGTDANGCSNSTSIVVSLNPSPSVSAAVAPSAICLGAQATLIGSGATSYTWSNGVNNPTDGVAFTSIISGTTTYTVTGTDGNGCIGTSTVDLTVNTLPIVTANALPNDTICANELLTLFGGGASTYLWSGGVNDNIPFLLATPTTYTVTGTDGNGCENTASIEIQTYPAPLPITINASPVVPEVCGINPVMLTASGGVNYSWSNGISNGVLFYPPSTNNYTVVSSDGNGCTVSSSVLVTVNPSTGNLALVVGANLASISGSSTTNYDQLENSHVKYYNAACNLICEIESGIGVNLGNVISQVLVSSAVLNYNGQPYVRRRFIITPTVNGPAINVILPVLQADFNTYNTASPTWPQLPTGPTDLVGIGNIRVTKVSGGTLGIGSPSVITPTVNWNGSYWELSFPLGAFSEFYIHSANPGNVPLPATITRFEGQKINTSNYLTWTTSNEQNNDYFNLQYSSNGIDFETIAKVNTKALNGNSSIDLNYEFEHSNPQLGHNYYRLEQVDIDQHSTYNAKVVDLVWSANGNTVSIYPNPTKGLVNIDLYATKAQNTTVKVLDMSGRIVKQLQAQCETGMNALSINLDEIASGIYTIQVYENNHLSHVSKVKKED